METTLIRPGEDNQLQMDLDKLNSLFQHPGIGNRKVAIVGVIGGPKSGKSFLLNYIQRFFRNPLDGRLNWMRDKDPQKSLEGFTWNFHRNVNEEVCVWNEPFILETDSQKEIAVFLLEFGGTDSAREFYEALAFRICSVLIINEIGHISASTLKCVMASYRKDAFIHPRIAFLVRDVSSEKYTKKDGEAFLLKECKQLDPNFLEKTPSFWRNAPCTIFPIPSFSKISPASDFKGNQAALDKQFAPLLGEFIYKTLDPNIMVECRFVTKEMIMQMWDNVCEEINDHTRAEAKPEAERNPDPSSLSRSSNTENNQDSHLLSTNIKTSSSCPQALEKSRISEDQANEFMGNIKSDDWFNQAGSKSTQQEIAANSSQINALRSIRSTSSPIQQIIDTPLTPRVTFRTEARQTFFAGMLTGQDGGTCFNFKDPDKSSSPAACSSDSYQGASQQRIPSVQESMHRPNSNDACSSVNSCTMGEVKIQKSETTPFEKAEISPTNSSLEGKTAAEHAVKLVQSPSFAQAVQQKQSTGENKPLQTGDIKDAILKTFQDCLKKFQLTWDAEPDLDQMKMKYWELARNSVSSVGVLSSVRGPSYDNKHESGEELQCKFDEKWKSIEDQYVEDFKKLTDACKEYENAYKEGVKSELKTLCDPSVQGFKSAVGNAKSGAEVAARNYQNFPKKFQPFYCNAIEESTKAINKKAKIVFELASNFETALEKKMNLFICLSDQVFQKFAHTLHENAVKEFPYTTDPDLGEILQGLFNKIYQKLGRRNSLIRASENEVAVYAMEYTKEYYRQEMDHFCSKDVHTSKALQEFHVELSSEAVSYFQNACKFHADSGVEVCNYISELKTALDKMSESFMNANSLKIMRASILVNKANSKARTEYNKIMTAKLNGKSLSENELQKCNDDAVKSVLVVYKLDIQKVAENCDEEIRTLREHLYKNAFDEFKEENAELKKLEERKMAEEVAANNRLIQFEEKKRREAECEKNTADAKSQQGVASQLEKESKTSASISGTTADASGPHVQISAIGIELGLQYIRAAYMDPDQGPRRLKLEDSDEALPLVIGVKNNKFVFGSAAAICEQKIELGLEVKGMRVNPSIRIILNKQEILFRYEELTALILFHVKQKCEDFLGQQITKAVLTIPSWYNHELRQATKDAAFLAGFEKNRLISEIVATALGWVHKKKSDLNAYGPTRLLVAVASNFSLDVAAVEVENSTVLVKKMVSRMSVSVGLRSKTMQVINSGSLKAWNEVNPETLVQKACSMWKGKADHCVLMETPGFEGPVNFDFLSTHCNGSHTPAKILSVLGASVLSAVIENESGLEIELKETPAYTLICEDWLRRKSNICETSGCLLERSTEFRVIRKIYMSSLTRMNLKVLEVVGDKEKLVGTIFISAPVKEWGETELQLFFKITGEGILSTEAMVDRKPSQVIFKTNNIPESELNTIRLQIQPILDSMGSAKACREAFQVLKNIEQNLRSHVNDSSKILKVLKPVILQEIDKTVTAISSCSSLSEIQEATIKLNKYSEKYSKT